MHTPLATRFSPRPHLTLAPFIAVLLVACGTPPETRTVDLADVFAARATRDLAIADVPTPALDLEAVRRAALRLHPGLAIERRRALTPLAQAEFAALWPDPELALNLERIVSGAANPLEWAAMLGLSVPLGGAPGARVAELRAEADWCAHRARRVELDHIERVDRAWVEWLEAKLLLEVLEDHAQRLTPLVEAGALAEEAGALEHAEADLLRLARTTALTATAAAERAVVARAAEVRRTIGLRGEGPLVLAVPGPGPPPDPLPGDPMDLHPRVAEVRAALNLAEARLRRSWSERHGALGLAAGPGRKDGESNVLFGLSVPLPLWNRNRAELARMTAERDIAAQELALAAESLLDETERAEAALGDARDARRRFEAEVLPLIEAQHARLERIAGLGELRLFVLLEAERTLRDARLEHASQITQEWHAGLALARALGDVPALNDARLLSDDPHAAPARLSPETSR